MPMTLIQMYAEYNVWANQTLVQALSKLSDEEYYGHAGLCFRSIHGTLNHILLADRLWYARLTKTTVDPLIPPHWNKSDDELFAKPNDTGIYWEEYVPNRNDLAQQLIAQAQEFTTFVKSIDNILVDFSYKTSNGTSQSKILGVVLQHVVNHATHHRGQVTAAITSLGYPPPSIDFIAFQPNNLTLIQFTTFCTKLFRFAMALQLPMSRCKSMNVVVRYMMHVSFAFGLFILYVYYTVATTTLVWTSNVGQLDLQRGENARRYQEMDSILIHLNRLNAACREIPNASIPWSYNYSNIDLLLTPSTNESVMQQLLSHCTDIDVYMPSKRHEDCEDAMSFVKFLNGRTLPQWIFERTFHYQGRPWNYMDVCHDTPILFLHPDDWHQSFHLPATKQIILVLHHYDYPEGWQLARVNYLITTSSSSRERVLDWYSKYKDVIRPSIYHITVHASSHPTLPYLNDRSSRDFKNLSAFHATYNRMDTGLQAILDCWLTRPDFPMLHVVDMDNVDEASINGTRNIVLHRMSSMESIASLLANVSIVIWPPNTERNSHVLNQARASGALITTTNASPMNELIDNGSGVLIQGQLQVSPSWWIPKWPLVRNAPFREYIVTSNGICHAIDTIMSMLPMDRARRARNSENLYFREVKSFEKGMFRLRIQLFQDMEMRHGG